MLTKHDFENLLQSPKITKVLMETGVDVLGLLDLLDIMFVQQPMPITDIIQGVLELRSCNTTTVKDLAHMRKFISNELDYLRNEFKLARTLGFAGVPADQTSKTEVVLQST